MFLVRRVDHVRLYAVCGFDAVPSGFRQVIEEETGRKVVAFMSSSHQHPDLLSEIFVLEAADVLGDELSDPGGDAR